MSTNRSECDFMVAPVPSQQIYCNLCLPRSVRLVQDCERCLLCAQAEGNRKLRQHNKTMSEHLMQAVEAHKKALERTVKLQTVIDDLSQRLVEQRQLVERKSRNCRESENECHILRRHARRQRNQIQEITCVIKSLRDRDKLAPIHCDVLLEIIDEPRSPESSAPLVQSSRPMTGVNSPQATGKNSHQTTPPGVLATTNTIRILHRALTFMSRLADPVKMLHLCGSADQGVFVNWMIAQVEHGGESQA